MMAEKAFELRFHGYCRDVNRDGLPAESAVYCVYTCVPSELPGRMSILSLLYIGEADDLREHLAVHENRPEWQARLGAAQQLCYSFAPVDPEDRTRCKAALVRAHRPPENGPDEGTFPFETTHFALEGKTRLLRPTFTVTESSSCRTA
jgi:hypothetical protein